MSRRRAKAGVLAVCVAGLPLFAAACDPGRDEPPARRPPCTPSAPSGTIAAPSSSVPIHVRLSHSPPPGVTIGNWASGGRCNLEYAGKVLFGSDPVVLKAGSRMPFSGWALDPAGKAPPDTVHLRFSKPSSGDYYFATALRRTVRDDVNASQGVEQRSTLSGFELEFETNDLPVGSYLVTTVMQLGEKTYVCDNGRKVTRVGD